jgi:hypothetical protein
MNSSAFYDPRLLGRAMKPTVKAQPIQREDDAQEVASFLLQLKHRSVTPEPHSHGDNSGLREKPRLPVSQPVCLPQSQGRELQAPFPVLGSVYGFPAAGFVERAPALMEEPVITDKAREQLLGDSNLVLMKDRDLVPDALFVAMSQMKPCKLTQADRVGCYKNRELGFVGMCCKHCAGQPGFGRYYPNSVRSLAQTTTSQTILKHIGSKCRFCPPEVRQAVLDLQRQQAAKEGMASGRPRYGSRKIFFQRMWARLHGKNASEDDDDSDSKHAEHNSYASAGEDHHSSASLNHESDDDSVGHRSTSPARKNKRKKSYEERETKRLRVVGL